MVEVPSHRDRRVITPRRRDPHETTCGTTRSHHGTAAGESTVRSSHRTATTGTFWPDETTASRRSAVGTTHTRTTKFGPARTFAPDVSCSATIVASYSATVDISAARAFRSAVIVRVATWSGVTGTVGIAASGTVVATMMNIATQAAHSAIGRKPQEVAQLAFGRTTAREMIAETVS